MHDLDAYCTCKMPLITTYADTVKPVLSGHSKIDKTMVLKTNGSSMKVKVLQNALLEHFAILLICIKQ